MCSSAGNCSAGGSYFNSPGFSLFVLSEKNGTWGQASNVPGLSGSEALIQLQCMSAGNCLGMGSYQDPHGGPHDPFTITQRDGTWAQPRLFPRLVADQGDISNIACSSLGNCTAVGEYVPTPGPGEIFGMQQKHGTWGPLTTIPGLYDLASTEVGTVTAESLSCPAQGDCTVGGQLEFPSEFNLESGQPFVATEKNGIWRNGQLLPGVGALSAQSLFADLTGVSCPSVGNCTADGPYLVNFGGGGQIYVSTEKHGAWGKAIQLSRQPESTFFGQTPVSCGAPGDCGVGGYFFLDRHDRPFVATEKDGVWSKIQPVKGVTP